MALFKQYSKPTDKIYKLLCESYGIGKTSARKLCAETGLSYTAILGDLLKHQTDLLEYNLRKIIPSEDFLRKAYLLDLYEIRTLNTYRSYRHRVNLPVRGQRTHSNAQTQRKIKRI